MVDALNAWIVEVANVAEMDVELYLLYKWILKTGLSVRNQIIISDVGHYVIVVEFDDATPMYIFLEADRPNASQEVNIWAENKISGLWHF